MILFFDTTTTMIGSIGPEAMLKSPLNSVIIVPPLKYSFPMSQPSLYPLASLIGDKKP